MNSNSGLLSFKALAMPSIKVSLRRAIEPRPCRVSSRACGESSGKRRTGSRAKSCETIRIVRSGMRTASRWIDRRTLWPLRSRRLRKSRGVHSSNAGHRPRAFDRTTRFARVAAGAPDVG